MHLEILDKNEPEFVEDTNPIGLILDSVKDEFKNQYGMLNFDIIYLIGVTDEKKDVALHTWMRHSPGYLLTDQERYHFLLEHLAVNADETIQSKLENAYQRGVLDGRENEFHKGFIFGFKKGKLEGLDSGKLEANNKIKETNTMANEQAYIDGYNKGYDDGLNGR